MKMALKKILLLHHGKNTIARKQIKKLINSVMLTIK
jgi:hypothetical protein